MKEKNSQIKIGAILSYIQIIAQMGINFLFTPIMLRILGQSEYGLYSTATSTISTLSILSLGFSSSYIKKFAEYKNNNDEKAMSSLNGLYIIIFTVIGTVAFICGMLLTININYLYGTGLTEAELTKARILMALLVFNLAVNFPLSVFNSIIGAHEKFIFQKLVYMIKSVLSPLVMIPVLLLGYSSVGMVLTTVTMALIADAINIYYCFTKLYIKFRFYGWEKGLLTQLFGYTAFIAINIVIDQINWNIDKVIIGRYRGTSSVAIYSVGHTIHSCYMSMAQNISNLFTPKVHAIASKYQRNIERCSSEFTELFIKVGRVQYLILILICTGFIFFGKKFISLWAGTDYENAYYVCLLLMIPATVPFIQTMGIEIQRSLNKHQFRSIFYLCMALCNLIMSIFFCQWWGEIGSALGTCIALVIADGIAMNIYYQKALKINVLVFWRQIIRMSFGLVLPVIFGIFCLTVLKTNSLVTFLVEIIIYSMIYCFSMYFISINRFEQSLITDVVAKIKRNS